LAVIVVIALVAAGATAFVFFAAVDVAGPELALQQVERDGGRAFQVTQVRGDLAWEDLTVELLDPSGADHAGFYLERPAGTVVVGQVLGLRSELPAGTWLLRIRDGGEEIVRLATVV
jgi:hypothetical protein